MNSRPELPKTPDVYSVNSPRNAEISGSPDARRTSSAETSGEIMQPDIETILDHRRAQEKFEEKRDEIKNYFKGKYIEIPTAQADLSVDLLLTTLIYPMYEYKEHWKIERSLRGKEVTLDEFAQKMQEYVNYAKGLLDSKTQDSGGWITPEKIVEMTESADEQANYYTTVLNSGDQELVKIYMAATNSSTEQAHIMSLAEAEKLLIKKFEECETANYKPMLWWILGFMTPESKEKIIKGYFAKRKYSATDFQKKDDFLEEGNMLGVLSLSEMVKIRGKAYEREKEVSYRARWEATHDYREKVKNLMRIPYGSVNPANEMLDMGSIGLFIAEGAAWSTLFANSAVGIWKMGGALKTPKGIVDATIGNTNNLAALGVLGLLRVLKSDQPFSKEFAESGERKKIEKIDAYNKLKNEVNGYTWPEWDGFFAGQHFAGLEAFNTFINRLKQANDDELPSNITPQLFLSYLAEQKRSKNPDNSDLDYGKLHEEFSRFGTGLQDELNNFASAFETLGTTQKDYYSQIDTAITEKYLS